MSLKIVVLVKQVPDTQNVTQDAMKPDGTVNREALPAIFNPEDLHALEEALKLKELHGGVITALTMGPPKAVEVLKECLYRGADDVALISDRKFAGADTLATSYALKCAIDKVAPYDLILCGRQAIDGDTAQVGPQIADKLGINQLTNVSWLEYESSSGTITVIRSIEDGYEKLRSRLPLLLTITSEANVPRPPSAKMVMAYKDISANEDESYYESYLEPDEDERTRLSHIKRWSIESIMADPEKCGLSGSATQVKKIENVVLAAREMKQIDNSEQGISSLIRELIDEHILG